MMVAITGVVILVIAVTGGLLLAGRNAAEGQRQTKILLFVLYFWLLAFAQLIAVALGYQLLSR
jgi:hypothetical protein